MKTTVSTRHLATLALALAASTLIATDGHAIPGDLDPTFGTGGKVITALSNSDDDYVEGIAIQPDGKIIAAGWTRNGTNPKFALSQRPLVLQMGR